MPYISGQFIIVLPYTFQLINPGFELGNTTGWIGPSPNFTVSSGYVTTSPRTGLYMGTTIGGSSNDVTFYQDLAIPAAFWTAIDAGSTTLSNVSGYHSAGPDSPDPGNDQGRLFISFLDGVGAEINRVNSAYDQTEAWTLIAIAPTAVPTLTRTFRIGTQNLAEDAVNDNFWDDFTNPLLS